MGTHASTLKFSKLPDTRIALCPIHLHVSGEHLLLEFYLHWHLYQNQCPSSCTYKVEPADVNFLMNYYYVYTLVCDYTNLSDRDC